MTSLTLKPRPIIAVLASASLAFSMALPVADAYASERFTPISHEAKEKRELVRTESQSFTVLTASAQDVTRDEYTITDPPPPPPPVVEEKSVGTGQATPSVGAVAPGSAQAIAAEMVAARGWGNDQFGCLVKLWQKESGWNYQALNKSSGAAGIPQALPGSKMATAGADWQTNPATQITWGLNYISGVYGTPCSAWGHSQSVNWY
jgi:hypothetical protein